VLEHNIGSKGDFDTCTYKQGVLKQGFILQARIQIQRVSQ
jgi:hypothetical protein